MLCLSLAPVFQRVDNAIQWIKLTPTNTFHPLDNVIHSLNNWSLVIKRIDTFFQSVIQLYIVVEHLN